MVYRSDLLRFYKAAMCRDIECSGCRASLPEEQRFPSSLENHEDIKPLVLRNIYAFVISQIVPEVPTEHPWAKVVWLHTHRSSTAIE